MDFIGYCNNAPSKTQCAQFNRNLIKFISIPVKTNGSIITGKTISSQKHGVVGLYDYCLTVIDFDVKNGDSLYASQLPHICKQTMLVQTGGGGIHAYFFIKDAIVKNQNHPNVKMNNLKQIDIRGEGGIIFAPGCKFTDHNQPYKLLNNLEPLLIDNGTYLKIMGELLTPKAVKIDTKNMRQGFIDIIYGIYKVPHVKDEITGVEEFSIWKAFYREVNGCGINNNDIWRIWNFNKTLQPEFDQLKAKVQISKIKTDILNKRPSKDFYRRLFPNYRETVKVKEKKPQWDVLFGQYWDENYQATMKWVVDWKEWVVYNPKGFYEKVFAEDFNKIVIAWMDSNEVSHSPTKLATARTRIQSDHNILVKDFDKDINIRNVKNGLLDLITLTLTPHNPEYLSLHQSNAYYLEEYEIQPTPCWDIMHKKYPINIQKFEWFIKCMIFNKMENELGLWVVGVNRSGKGSALNMVEEMFSSSMLAHQSINLIGKDFAMGPMIGKLSNVDKEGIIGTLSAFAIKYYKLIVGWDKNLTVNLKHKAQVEAAFTIFFFITAMNLLFRLPPTDQHSFFSRVLIVEFNKQEANPDPIFKEKLKKEVDSIFSKLIHEGYESFKPFYGRIFGKKYQLEEYIYDTKELWDSWSNPIQMACKYLFRRDVGMNRISCEVIEEKVGDRLSELDFEIPRNLKNQITLALKGMNIKKPRGGAEGYYTPIYIFGEDNADLNKSQPYYKGFTKT